MAQVLQIEGKNYIGNCLPNTCRLGVTKDKFGLTVFVAPPPSSNIPSPEDSLYPYYWELQYNLCAYSDGKDVWVGYTFDHLTKLKRSQWQLIEDPNINYDEEGNAIHEN